MANKSEQPERLTKQSTPQTKFEPPQEKPKPTSVFHQNELIRDEDGLWKHRS
jgi:hypothetical protein